MPSVTIPDEVFHRLASRAAMLNMTVEQLIAPLLDFAAESTAQPSTPSFDDWKKRFDGWMADVRARAHRYPPEFVLDDSRESIYQGCGE